MSNVDIFDVEEMEVINRLSDGEVISKFTREMLLERIRFCVEINEGEQSDKEILALCEGLRSKVENLTEAEWDSMKVFLPFSLAYSVSDQPPEDETA